MNTKNIKLTVVIFITLCFTLIFYGVFPNLSSADFSLFNFSKGMLAGMSGVAAFVWLLFLISTIKKSYKSKGLIPLIINSKEILLKIGMFFLLIGTILATYFSNSPFFLITGAIVMCISMVFNIIHLMERKSQSSFNN